MPKSNNLTLFVLRHGKASKEMNIDFERPLTKRGQQQSRDKGILLKEKLPSIDVVICSAAVRTRETLDYLNLNTHNTHVIIEKDLYLCDADILLNYIHQIHHAKSILLIGHNPGLHQFAYDLLPFDTTQRTKQEDELASSFPTCALAEFHFSCAEWSQIHWHKGSLVAYYK